MTIFQPTTQPSAVSVRIADVAGDVDPQLPLAPVDLYRDIHKGIRSELFAITSTAGSIDPEQASDCRALAAHVNSTVGVLTMHAEHEDTHIDPVLRELRPDLAEQITSDHTSLDARFAHLSEMADALVESPVGDRRRLVHVVYLELSAFTSRYLTHQLIEENEIMPALTREIGPEACGALHGAIVTSIPPDEMARSLAFMLPAMNTPDRFELLSGIRAGAPAEAFEAIRGLAASVLQPVDYRDLAARLAAG